MRWTLGVTCAAALVGMISADSAAYHDSETGFTFSQSSVLYALGRSITVRIAVPSPVPANSAYDAVIQVVAPIDVGWFGLAWGGKMPQNPLTVGWAYGSGATVSSRYASGHVTPAVYTGASYDLFKPGTHVNGTHWQYTARCKGCTFFNNGAGNTFLDPSGVNRLAFAYSSTKPASPSSNISTITVHDVTGYWSHDFSAGANTAFASLIQTNLGHA